MLYTVILLADKLKLTLGTAEIVQQQFPKLVLRFTDPSTIPASLRIAGTTVKLKVEHRGVELWEPEPFRAKVTSADNGEFQFQMLENVDLMRVPNSKAASS